MLKPGTHLGHFTVLSRIGAGGMGEVYQARDDRLEREVAIKVLPAEVAGDAERLARFEREAKALARLSHPNILGIHEFAEESGVAYVVTELLEGETLQERLGRGAMSWRTALETGAAIADGLAAAHEQGVVHRDIKPSNVFLTESGAVKVLDFGLARMHQKKPAAEAMSKQSTLTHEGAVVGTPGYMSPEQVRGGPVDARSDIFSFGTMLYEMLSGRSPFKRDTPVETLAAILNEEPPELSVSGIDTTPELDRLLKRCMHKSPAQRYQSAGDLAHALRSLLETSPSGGAAPAAGAPARPRARRARWLAAVAAVLIAGVAAVWTITTRDVGSPAAADPVYVAVLPFANMTGDPGQEYFCDGMAEEVINALAQVSGLRVVARSSSFAFKGQSTDVREIGRRLDVGALVEGSVRQAGEKLRITARLVDTEKGLNLWSERFERSLEDVFEIQDEITLAVLDTLEVELLGSERAAVVRRPTDNLDAYNACLQGWFYWNSLTPEGYVKSYEYFNEAIELDPDLLWAYEGLTAWYLSQSWWGTLAPEAALAAVAPIVERVQQHGDTYLAHAMRAALATFERDWATVDEAYGRTLELAPSAVLHQLGYALTLLERGRFDEGNRLIRQAQRLDPLSPFLISSSYAWLAYSGNIDESLEGLEKLVEMYPHLSPPHGCLSSVLVKASRLEEARPHAEQAVELSGGSSVPVGFLAGLCYLLGDEARGDELSAMLRERERSVWVPPTIFGSLHLVRGEIDEAVQRFEEAARRKDPWVVNYRLGSLVPIPDDPRFDALDEALGLPARLDMQAAR